MLTASVPMTVTVEVRTVGGRTRSISVDLLYCDVCRRFGAPGSTHSCPGNWSEHLFPVVSAAAASMPELANGWSF